MNIKELLKKNLLFFGIKPTKVIDFIALMSLRMALSSQKFWDMVRKLRVIVPDVSQQESREVDVTAFWELKKRGLQAFQCSLMIQSLENLSDGKITVVDIGDSAGTHMQYLKKLFGKKFDSLSVNLDERAIAKIRAKNLPALLCRAEDLDLGEKQISLFTSFEMVEHLHNPAIFFHRLAKKSSCQKMLLTVPFLRNSRVGLHSVRFSRKEIIFAEDEHIFELSPEDWTLLFLHSGWRVIWQKTYFQYPTNLPGLSWCLSSFWKKFDFEGFWGVLLERDTTFSDFYRDWED